jgi:TatD DNase family protein
LPLDRLMVETDAPDQAPHPHRGQRCEPAHLSLTIAAMARGLGRPVDEVRLAVTQNARRFFAFRNGASTKTRARTADA